MIDANKRNVIAVGATDLYGVNPAHALHYLPRTASGNRLRVVMGLTDLHYHCIRRYNLCSAEWQLQAAQVAAEHLKTILFDSVFILLGTNVRKAFDKPGPWLITHDMVNNNVFLTLPHPSGRNRMWNVPGAKARALALLAEAAPGVPWGTDTPASPVESP